MGRLGLEPRTIRLKAEYSTIELVTPYFPNIILKIKLFYERLNVTFFLKFGF